MDNPEKTPMPREPAILARLVELSRNCNLGKYRHFNAATRAKRLNDLLGVPVVSINIGLGSVFFITLTRDIPDFAKWLGGFLAMGAAMISGVATFFNFGKSFEGHRAIANKYLELGIKIETAIARYSDGLLRVEQLNELIDQIQERYGDIGDEAKGFSTSPADFSFALESEEIRSAKLRTRKKNEAHPPPAN